MINEILENIDEIQDSVFNFSIAIAKEKILVLIDQISKLIIHVVNINLPDLNKILTKLMNGMENNDYLFIADVLEFELKPFLEDNFEDEEDFEESQCSKPDESADYMN